jgi:cytochrome c biogenesis protein CcmG, thiol:disulfide interchange protein DsbE
MSKKLINIAAATLMSLVCGAANAMKVGDRAPDFVRADLAKKPVQLSEYRGKLVLLNFWATWCAPCREEMPAFSQWQREYGTRGLQIIGVSMDDDADAVKQFLAEYPVSYSIVMGDAKLAESFGGVLGLPLTFLIDQEGRVVARFQGQEDVSRIETAIKQRLSRKS